MKIYGNASSGNCLKVKYICDYLEKTYEWVEVDLTKKESRQPDFLQMNPFGQVPLLQLDNGKCLSQSNAILRYLGKHTSLIPQDAYDEARMDSWLFWEQYSHEPAIAVLRSKVRYQKLTPDQIEPEHAAKCHAALKIMQEQLAETPFLTGNSFTLADIALLAYTRLAPEAHLDLTPYADLRRWIQSCESKLGLAAL